jgi:hypothetical protein
MLNQLKAGLKVRVEERVEKPAELVKYQQMKSTGLPLWAGGVQDQPHIWLYQVLVIEDVIEVFRKLDEASRPSKE